MVLNIIEWVRLLGKFKTAGNRPQAFDHAHILYGFKNHQVSTTVGAEMARAQRN